MNGKGPQKALEDKKVQRDLKEAANSLKSAADALREKPKRKKRRRGGLLVVGLVGAGLALALSESLRSKVLDALFGSEEEFEYTSTTTPAPAATQETRSAPSALPPRLMSRGALRGASDVPVGAPPGWPAS